MYVVGTHIILNKEQCFGMHNIGYPRFVCVEIIRDKVNANLKLAVFTGNLFILPIGRIPIIDSIVQTKAD